MNNRFKPNHFDVQSEKPRAPGASFTPGHGNQGASGSQGSRDARNVQSEQKRAPQVEKYEFTRFGKQGTGTYSEVRARYGALASTDTDRPGKSQKDSRFALNELVRGPLSVADEEKRAIDAMVQARLQELAELERKRGFEAGRREGFEKGREEAFGQFQAEAQDGLARLESLVNEAEALKSEIYRANERFLIELVFRASRMVLLRELKTDEQYVTRLARELVDRSGLRDNIHLLVSPQDRALIGTLKDSLEASLGTLKNLTVEASNQVSPGGCRIETDWNAIDASIEGQLAAVHEALLGDLAATHADGSGSQGAKGSDS